MDQFEQDTERATERAKQRLARDPRAGLAHYDTENDLIVIALNTGYTVSFPPEGIQGLAGASAFALAEIEITPSGYGLHWPKLDADLWVPALLEGVFGSRAWMAARLGAQGGKATSDAKAAAARENGKRGGRPLLRVAKKSAHAKRLMPWVSKAATHKRSAWFKATAKPKSKLTKSKGGAVKASARRKAAAKRRPQRSKVRA